MWWFFLIIISIVLIVMGTIGQQKKREEVSVSNESILKKKGFNVSKKISNPDNTYVIFIDNDNGKWAILNTLTSKLDNYDYKDLIEYELLEDGESLVKGRVGSAIVGGALFGAIGAVAGASRKKKVKPVCNSMSVRILVNNLDNPQHNIPIITTQTKTDGMTYKFFKQIAEQFTSLLAVVKERAEEVA